MVCRHPPDDLLPLLRRGSCWALTAPHGRRWIAPQAIGYPVGCMQSEATGEFGISVVQTALATAIGGRSEQQDRAAGWCSAGGRHGLWVVADGMGGHAGGALAAQTVVEVAARHWLPTAAEWVQPDTLLEDLCLAAHEEINRRGAAAGLAPHSTLVVLYLQPESAWWVHVGDSRLYRFRDGVLLYRTRDHSVAQAWIDQAWVDPGGSAEKDGRISPSRHVLTTAVGGTMPPRMAHGHALRDRRDGWVLCTDGLWEGVREDDLAEALRAPDLQRAAEGLVQQAVERNGPNGDNVTVLLLREGSGTTRVG